MTPKRYTHLNESEGQITQAELDAGWHYCNDWDFLLVGPDMKAEWDCCTCFPKKNANA